MIAIILVNWNGCSDTVECLESLMRLNTDDFLAIVVDNGSTDGSIPAILNWAAVAESAPPVEAAWRSLPERRRRQPVVITVTPDGSLNEMLPGSVALVAAGANLGFAGANNVGMTLARLDPRVRYVFLLNNDTIVTPDILERLSAMAEQNPKAAMIGPCLMYYHEPDLVQGVAGFFLPWRAGGGHIGFGLAHDQLPSSVEVEASMSYVMGAAMFLPIATLDEVGLMSEEYFLYYEELDWARRLGVGRQRLAVCLDAIVYHKEGGSIGTSSLRRPSETSLYYLYRNLLRFVRRWHPWLIPVAILRIFREMLRYRSDRAALAILWLGLIDGAFRKNVRRVRD